MTKKKKERKERLKNRYVFGDKLSKMMSNVTMRAQLEMSMLSQFLLIIGLTLMVILNLIAGGMNLWTKIIVTFNLICGWFLIFSYLITTFQQYQSYMDALGIDSDEEKKNIKKRGNIFKRIALARRNKKIVKRSIAPKLVIDALNNMKENTNKKASDEDLEKMLIQLEGSEK